MPCPVPKCKGTGKADCPTCKGSGKVTCSLCKGAKEIPDPAELSASPVKSGNPPPAGEPPKVASPAPTPQKKKPELIRLKGGKTILGNIVITDPDSVWVKTPEGKTVQVQKRDLEIAR